MVTFSPVEMIEFYEKMNLFVEQLEMLKQNLMVQTDIIGWMTAGSETAELDRKLECHTRMQR